jgi:hypothetical protein
MEMQVGGHLIELYILGPIVLVTCLAGELLFPFNLPPVALLTAYVILDAKY